MSSEFVSIWKNVNAPSFSTFSNQTWKECVKFSFTNRLNGIIPLLSDSWLDESEKQMKKTLKTEILDIVPAKCDS